MRSYARFEHYLTTLEDETDMRRISRQHRSSGPLCTGSFAYHRAGSVLRVYAGLDARDVGTPRLIIGEGAGRGREEKGKRKGGEGRGRGRGREGKGVGVKWSAAYSPPRDVR